MATRDRSRGAQYSIDVADFVSRDGDVQLWLMKLAERWEARLASLSAEERAAEEARAAAEEEALAELCAKDERSYENAMKDAEESVQTRHQEIVASRAAGVVGTLTELGRPFGLSGIAVGRILDQHGLRVRVDVDADRFPSPMQLALRKHEAEKRERWRAFCAAFRPNEPQDTPSNRVPSVLHLLRGLVDGFAIHDPLDSREYWITEKVAPLLESHAKCRR